MRAALTHARAPSGPTTDPRSLSPAGAGAAVGTTQIRPPRGRARARPSYRDPGRHEVDYSAAVPLTGKAGAITIHRVRAVHGSAPNRSSKARPLLLFQFRRAAPGRCWASRK